MKDKKHIRFVFFDIGGVILKFRHQFDELEKQHGVNKSTAHRVWIENIDDLTLGVKNQDEVWRIICAEAECVHLKDLKWDEFRAQIVIPISETHELIRMIEQSEIGLGIISNAERGIIAMNMRHGKIPDARYHVIVDSSAVQLKKPDTAIFKHAQSLIDVPKHEVLLVDDLAENCEAARHFGWHAIQFDEDNPVQSIQKIRAYLPL